MRPKTESSAPPAGSHGLPGDEQTESRHGILEVPGGMGLYHGDRLNSLRVGWRLAGAARAPVVAALGGISAHRTVYSLEGTVGWWDNLVGPGRALDSRRFRILGFDYLGGSGETTGPGTGEAFPSVSTYDQAAILLRLINHLGIAQLHAIAGASYGGMVALAFSEQYPERLKRQLVISAADRSHPMATAWRSVQRRAVRYALRHGEGEEGLKLARALAMATYRSPEEFAARFRAPPTVDEQGYVFPVERYLFARGADYAAQYRAESFVCLSESIDLHAVDASRIRIPATLIAVHEDQLVPLADMRALAARLEPQARLVEFSSIYGHDAFLKAIDQLSPVFSSTLESSADE